MGCYLTPIFIPSVAPSNIARILPSVLSSNIGTKDIQPIPKKSAITSIASSKQLNND